MICRSAGHMYSWLARKVERAAGSGGAFSLAVLTIVVWAATGPIFDWSDTWQLVINTGTTIVTFLMVFLIQHTQTRDTEALHVKLDELIRVTEARNTVIGAEDMSDTDRTELRQELKGLADE